MKLSVSVVAALNLSCVPEIPDLSGCLGVCNDRFEICAEDTEICADNCGIDYGCLRACQSKHDDCLMAMLDCAEWCISETQCALDEEYCE